MNAPASRTDVLRACQLFAHARDETTEQLGRSARWRFVPAGDDLLRAGDDGRDVFVVTAGLLEALRPEGPVGLGPGEVVGERAHLDGGTRAVSVRARRDTEVVQLPAASFARALEEDPGLLRGITAALANRLVPTAGEDRQTTVIAVIPAGSTGPETTAVFADELSRAMKAVSRSALVDRARVDDALGDGAANASPSTPEGSRLVQWLTRVEDDQEVVVYRADEGPDEWTARCVRQADRVVVVADPDADAQPNATERALASSPRADRSVDLVLVWPDGEPSGTARWFEDRTIERWHHVEAGSPGDHERVARHLTGNAVGLVLGAGGARGLAHVGVMRALDDLGIPIDAVGGTSIGAIMGGLCAWGDDDAARSEKVHEAFVRTRRLVGPTLPLVSLSSSRKLTRMLQSERYCGDTAIEDLRLPFFCVSASFSKGEPVVHDRGPLWWALRASISMAGVLPPVYSDGDLLVDGGAVNAVPVDVMRERMRGTVVAVNLRGGERRPFDEVEPTISGWRALARRLDPRRRGPRVPGAAATLLRAKQLAAKQPHRERLELADVLIEPPVTGTDTLDFRGGWHLIGPAYEAAVETLDREFVGATARQRS